MNGERGEFARTRVEVVVHEAMLTLAVQPAGARRVGNGWPEYLHEQDEHGGFDVPQEVAEWFMERFPRFWREAEPIPLAAQVAEVTETTEPERPVKAKPGPKPKPKVEGLSADGAAPLAE